MAKVCEWCGKRPTTGNLVSHSQRKTRRRWLPNIQKVKLFKDGVKQTVTICARCLKTYNKRLTLVT